MSIRNTIAAAEQRKRPTLPEGFVGEIALGSLISQNDLESLTGFSAVGAGTNLINQTGNAWLRFNVGGKELYVAKKPMRNNVKVGQLSSIGAIDGTKIITVSGKQYKVRLLTGVDNIAVPTNVGGGEWDSLLVRTHQSHPAATRWADYTNDDLGMTTSSTGGVCICQGRYANSPGGQPLGQLCRGYPDAVRGVWYLPDNDASNGYYGWRPVLERV